MPRPSPQERRTSRSSAERDSGTVLVPALPAEVVARVLVWYEANARDLPWRRPDAGPWAVMISEVMLQQTPVARVMLPFADWTARWPVPAALAADLPAAALAAWGRLGYPRRALRLHAAAVAIVQTHGGDVPESYGELRALPGVGDYTAAAITSFGFGRRAVVLDTNVRRVLARVAQGRALPAPGITVAERELASSFLPEDPAGAAAWAAASMELGALVCTARAPRCDRCPVADVCAWRAAGHPADTEPRRRSQPYEGTDRQCRGRILDLLRTAATAGDGTLPVDDVVSSWPDRPQADRALTSLVADGLVHLPSPAQIALGPC